MKEDELEEGELDDDDGECDDAAPDITDLKTSKCEPGELCTTLMIRTWRVHICTMH